MQRGSELSEHVVHGIRHHGPGSARSLVAALEEYRPDALLIEGPPEAEPLLSLAAHAEMRPPVALLIYDPQSPRRCAFYPFAEFSPEWQAIRFGLKNNIPIRLMDLPQSITLALRAEAELKEEESAESAVIAAEKAAEEAQAEVGEGETEAAEARRDPLSLLARAAGYDDSERWWEHLVEQRQDSAGLFAAIREAMHALRSELLGGASQCEEKNEARREACMRNTIRQAKKDGFERIAVICGAWHAPALAELPSAKSDTDLLKGLPKLKAQCAWVPWTYGRIARHSGYGAGVVSPGWYDFLWAMRSKTGNGAVVRELSAGWLARVAKLLRDKQFDVSTAHVIEAVRLAEALTALRGRSLPGLDEFNEAVQTVILMGDPTAMALIENELIVGERMGEVPSDAPTLPIQQDLARLQKSLRLPPSADSKDCALDLRKENDLERSKLLHRLRLLNIPWGEVIESPVRGKGTFRETWRVQWQPEFAIEVIEAGIWGNTIESAASAFAVDQSGKTEELAGLTQLVNLVLLAGLEDAIRLVMQRLDAIAALTGDVARMMDALPPLGGAMRYGSVRATDIEVLGRVIAGLVARICIGLVEACYSLDDDAARAMLERIGRVDDTLRTLENDGFTAQWVAALEKLIDAQTLHGLVGGRVTRVLLDRGRLDAAEAGRRMGLALSRGADPIRGGAWVEGFLQGSGMVLLHTDALWAIIDDWVCALGEESFTVVLPLLRRTFASFPAPERRMMGERVKREARAARVQSVDDQSFDAARAQKVIPILELLLDLEPESTHG